MKHTCLMFSEGGRDKKFLIELIPLLEAHHAKNWAFNYDNAHGSSPRDILERCKSTPFIGNYALVICLIDLDKLKDDYPSNWIKEKGKLEQEYSDFNIVWQIENAEDEYEKVLGKQRCSKDKLNIMARQKIKKFINSDLWKKILKLIKNKEQELA